MGPEKRLASRASHVRLCSLSIQCVCPLTGSLIGPSKEAPIGETWNKGKEDSKVICVSGIGLAEPWIRDSLCLRRCPWIFECVVMDAWYECHYLIGIGTEAKLLIELLTSWAVLLRSSPDSFDSVRELNHRIKVLLEEAALYFCC